VKLLRVLQEHEVRPVGGSQLRPVDVRVLAATNVDLTHAVADGRFRSDLYYRIKVVTIALPPLRDRREDVPLLVDHLLKRAARQCEKDVAGVSEAALAVLRAYNWPGNIRELRNVLERALLTSPDGRLHLDRALPASPPAAARPVPPSAEPRAQNEILSDRSLRRLERDNMVSALERAGWRVAGKGGAAELLGVRPSTLKSRMKALGIGRADRDRGRRDGAVPPRQPRE
jgi:transcriptional regulator with GAF, ATPase, and Fis domain